MKKKFVSIILSAAMVAALGACGDGDGQQEKPQDIQQEEGSSEDQADLPAEGADDVAGDSGQAETGTYPAEKVLIGVELYDPTDTETIAMQEYFSYLAESMNVEFKYSEAIEDADDEMKFIEDCAISGCQGFLAYYNVTGVEQLNAVTGYEMYYWGGAEDETRYEAFKESPYYLGSVHTGNNDYQGGQNLAAWVVEQNFNKVIFANGGADFGVKMFVDRQQGFLDGLEGHEVEVITVSGFPGDQFFADQSAALSQEGVQAVVASFNGVNFWAQPIETAGLKDTVKLASIGSVNEQCVQAFESGALSFLNAANIQRFGFAVGMICNAVDGNADALKNNGLATNLEIASWAISDGADCKKIYDIQMGEHIFTADDIKSLCVKVNPDASEDTLKGLIESATEENLLNR